ncbi:hypothetical protein O181_036401 [Austropuccinia psidii MF-1]|uniref:Uncharacterized protein n=1 Tax=Austropuccinia psidii MF-1 TaxID=1389203 RepID=A0A9Q3DA54_9BASI|nr:hypothetical protein [Austropuccinia psidii MF-1]
MFGKPTHQCLGQLQWKQAPPNLLTRWSGGCLTSISRHCRWVGCGEGEQLGRADRTGGSATQYTKGESFLAVVFTFAEALRMTCPTNVNVGLSSPLTSIVVVLSWSSVTSAWHTA